MALQKAIISFRMQKKWRIAVLLSAFFLGGILLQTGNALFILLESPTPSQSSGTKTNGSLRYGKRLPTRGANFVAYSSLATLLGRNTVHSAVRKAVLEAYQGLEQKTPGVTFVYGETGWPWGGRFWPHESHQNGLSVDFFVPVVDENGHPIILPHSIFTKFGYGLEFDGIGSLGVLQIDFPTMAAHLEALEQAARRNGLAIDLVVFAPELQQYLWQTPRGKKLQKSLRFSTEPSWMRHDAHYRVDFALLRTTRPR
ncbi:MAG: replication initiation protein [Candidatus Binatia bacterium]